MLGLYRCVVKVILIKYFQYNYTRSDITDLDKIIQRKIIRFLRIYYFLITFTDILFITFYCTVIKSEFFLKLVIFLQAFVYIFLYFSEIVLVFQCQETHVICVDCFARYVESKLNQRQFILSGEIGYTLSCPGLGG